MIKSTFFWNFLCLAQISLCYDSETFLRIFNDFNEEFKNKFDKIVLGELDWHSKMELSFGYHITAIKIGSIKQSTFEFDKTFQSLVFKSKDITLELLIDDQHLLPVKAKNFQFIFNLDTDKVICIGTEISYNDLSIGHNRDIQNVINSDFKLADINDAIQQSVYPIKNLLNRSLKKNSKTLELIAEYINDKKLDSKRLLYIVMNEIEGFQVKEDYEFWVNTRTFFELESLNQIQNNSREDL